MARKLTRRKRKAPGIRITPVVGLWIKYQFGLRGITQAEFGRRYGYGEAGVSKVLHGLRKSAPMEAAICRFLGYTSLDALIAASRGKGETV
jgi:transcriptional regulator with XRE-family HTH domain